MGVLVRIVFFRPSGDGTVVLKLFDGKPFRGVIAGFDADEGYYKVKYDDGDEEQELEEGEVATAATAAAAAAVFQGAGAGAE